MVRFSTHHEETFDEDSGSDDVDADVMPERRRGGGSLPEPGEAGEARAAAARLRRRSGKPRRVRLHKLTHLCLCNRNLRSRDFRIHGRNQTFNESFSDGDVL